MLSFFMTIAKWLQSTWWALDISGSTWAYPFVQMTHFSGLSLWIGTNLSLDLRLMGVGKKRRKRIAVTKRALPPAPLGENGHDRAYAMLHLTL